MKSYSRTFLKCAVTGLFIINSIPISSSTKNVTITMKTHYGKRQIKLDNLPQWFLESQSKQKENFELRQQALQILKNREQQKQTALNLLRQHDTPQSSLSSSSQSACLGNQNESSHSSLTSSSESFLSKLH